jgi:hypothetical protein
VTSLGESGFLKSHTAIVLELCTFMSTNVCLVKLNMPMLSVYMLRITIYS